MAKIYLASSWKNAETVMAARDLLKERGHSVDCFCDESNGRTSFNWSQLGDINDLNEKDARDMLRESRVREAFEEDKKWLDWADTVILLLPCGKSAHLEAGYGKGQGKRLYIVGGFEKGDFDVMYGFADRMYDYREFNQLGQELGA